MFMLCIHHALSLQIKYSTVLWIVLDYIWLECPVISTESSPFFLKFLWIKRCICTISFIHFYLSWKFSHGEKVGGWSPHNPPFAPPCFIVYRCNVWPQAIDFLPFISLAIDCIINCWINLPCVLQLDKPFFVPNAPFSSHHSIVDGRWLSGARDYPTSLHPKTVL